MELDGCPWPMLAKIQTDHNFSSALKRLLGMFLFFIGTLNNKHVINLSFSVKRLDGRHVVFGKVLDAESMVSSSFLWSIGDLYFLIRIFSNTGLEM